MNHPKATSTKARSVFRSMRHIAIVCAFLAAVGCLAFYQTLTGWSRAPFANPSGKESATVLFEPGMSLAQLSKTLEEQEVISDALNFRLFVRFIARNYHQFQAGTYQFTLPETPLAVVEKIAKGDIYQPIVLSIAVPEGFTLKLLLSRLEAHGLGPLSKLQAIAKNPSFLSRLNITSGSLEGFIYPATYNFFKMPTAEEAMTVMVKNFWKNLPPNYEKNAASKGLSLLQAVTFASLIELETQADEERPLVSEVIWRRLKDKAPLGIDAAIIYGIKDYTGDLKWKHLSDTKNPYNTRMHIGLPPGPIGSPSRKSLEAVLTPANQGYYYYVLKAGTKRHHFSRTLAEHNQAVKELVAALRTKRHDDVGDTDSQSGTQGQKRGHSDPKEVRGNKGARND